MPLSIAPSTTSVLLPFPATVHTVHFQFKSIVPERLHLLMYLLHFHTQPHKSNHFYHYIIYLQVHIRLSFIDLHQWSLRHSYYHLHKMVSRQLPPRKTAPRIIAPEKNCPGQFPPGKMSPRKTAPWKIAQSP